MFAQILGLKKIGKIFAQLFAKKFGPTNLCANIFANICANFWKKNICAIICGKICKKISANFLWILPPFLRRLMIRRNKYDGVGGDN